MSVPVPQPNADVHPLDDVAEFLARYVAFPSDEALTAVALWVVHCHLVDAFESTPRLALLSPERGSGKTRTLEALALLVPMPIHTVNISPAALYRLVNDKTPTLLLDEADTYLGNTIAKQHEDLRGLINAGHRRGATVYRGEISGKTIKAVEFRAYAPCALAGIGDLPDTILDRSVIVSMKRRAPHERVDAFRERLVKPEADELRERITEWADKHFAALQNAWPDMPTGITDRAADVWEPLVAIADLAGGIWPERARLAAVAINSARRDRDPSLGVQLLADCRRVFSDRDADRLTTQELLEALLDLDESPWGDLRGKSLNDRGLATRLRKYEVRPGSHRFENATKRGYLREDFHDAWQRYLAPPVADVADVADAHVEERAGAPVAVLQEGVGVNPLSSYEDKPKTAEDPLRPPSPKEAQQPQHLQPSWFDSVDLEELERQAETDTEDTTSGVVSAVADIVLPIDDGPDPKRPPLDESLVPYDLDAELAEAWLDS
ncbi:MAG TPA: DUF3631 domain-containing protein [Gaiellaceae bacterium]|nr:DUF3631 domain-containing protein [Gaiellaceae bacterium]